MALIARLAMSQAARVLDRSSIANMETILEHSKSDAQECGSVLTIDVDDLIVPYYNVSMISFSTMHSPKEEKNAVGISEFGP
jgi:hypothetical protein